MFLGYRGSVNRWECDENDHLNVRFYVQHHWQTLMFTLPQLGLRDAPGGAELEQHLQVQHLRFLAEARIATPISGYAGLVQVDLEGSDSHLAILTELRHSHTGEVLSTCLHLFNDLQVRDGVQLQTMPGHAAPRGLPQTDTPYAQLARAQAEDYGFHLIGRGVVAPTECGGQGELLIQQYMGRMSDSMPHLWQHLSPPEQVVDHDGTEGGAVLEYRMRYHRRLRSGEAFDVCSGISAAASKVQQFTHLLFEAGSGALCVSAMAVAVRMDLQARRAVTLNEARLAHLRTRLLRPAG